jgi:hypothetical protein
MLSLIFCAVSRLGAVSRKPRDIDSGFLSPARKCAESNARLANRGTKIAVTFRRHVNSGFCGCEGIVEGRPPKRKKLTVALPQFKEFIPMRIIGSAFVAATLFVTSAFAATDSMAPLAAPVAVQSAGALAPGKPAGIQKAQGSDNTIWWILGAGLVVGGIVLIATNNGSSSVTPPVSTSLTQ